MDRERPGAGIVSQGKIVMADISLVSIRNSVLKDVSLDIHKGEIFVLVGPSGAGKTTLLEVVAGLSPCQGQILFNNKSLQGVPPHRRKVGYMFQELLLFPHLTVSKNLRIAMTCQRISRKNQQQKIHDLLDMMGLMSLENRFPYELSGGEKQRVALARSLAGDPEVLLLDEPFSSLDFRVSRYLRLEFKRLQQKLGITALFVTHNLKEAREMAHRIGVIRDGRLIQVASPNELWLKADSDTSAFLEKPNILNIADPHPLGNGLIHVKWAGFSFYVPDEGKPFERVLIRPKEVYISTLPPPGATVNRFEAQVKDIIETEGMARVILEVGDDHVDAEISVDYLKTLNLCLGDWVYGILKLRELHGI